VTHPKVSSDPRLRERYGIKSAGKNRIWITLFSLFLVLSWFIWSGTNFANPDIRSTLISFKVVSDQKISIGQKSERRIPKTSKSTLNMESKKQVKLLKLKTICFIVACGPTHQE
jgi:hypothetical protein